MTFPAIHPVLNKAVHIMRRAALTLAALTTVTAGAYQAAGSYSGTANTVGPIAGTFQSGLTISGQSNNSNTGLFSFGGAATSIGTVRLNGIGSPLASMFSPTTLDVANTSAMWYQVTGNGCAPNTTASGNICNMGTLTITFGRPVTNPIMHISGIGGVSTSTNTTTGAYIYDNRSRSIFNIATPGITFTSLGTPTNLSVTSTQVTTASSDPNTSCQAIHTSGRGTVAGCGTVQLTGTFSSVIFNMQIAVRRVAGTDTNFADDPAVTDGMTLAFTVDEDYGDAPNTYNGGVATSNVLGDLRLGTGVTADATTALSPAASPVASADATGDTDDAFSGALPMITPGSTYSLNVPVSGVSAAGKVCGWIDFDKGGTFNTTTEQACTSIAAGATSATLSFTAPGTLTGGDLLFLRVRTAYGTANLTPTGRLDSGETEDYQVKVAKVADLFVTKTDSKTAVDASGATSYIIRVTNNGPSSVTGATLSDSFLTGLLRSGSITCTSATSNTCTAAPTAFPVTLPILASGAFYEISVPFTVSASNGTVSNTATIAIPSDVADPDSTNNTATDTDTVTPITDILISKTGPASVLAGETVSYTITVWNKGPSVASGVNITDAVPANLSNVTWTCVGSGSAVCNTSSGSGAVNLTADMGANPVTTTPTSGPYVTITVTGTAGLTGSITNTANATHANDSTANSASATTTINPKADLSISKTGPSSVVAGTQITYTLTLSNAGPSAANGATYSDNVANTLTGVTAICLNATGGAAGCTATVGAGNNVTGTVATFPAGSSVQVQITGTVPAGATATLTNSATITAPSGVTDTDTANNTSNTVSTTLTKTADLSLTKTSSGSNNLHTGDTFTYTIVVANAGPSTTTVNFQDQTFSGVSLSNWTCAGTTGTANCPGSLPTSGGYSNTLLNLPTGSSITFTVTATVTADTGSASNTASIDAPSGVTDSSGSTNNTATVTNTIIGGQGADLRITKTATTPVKPGQPITYTLTVTNNGPARADDVVVTDQLPTGLTYVSSTPTATVSGQTLTWNLGSLANGATQVITVSAVAPDAATLEANPSYASLTNNANVTSSTRELNTGNNATSATTELFHFKVSKTVRNVSTGTPASSTGGGKPGEVLEYCINVTNDGALPVTQLQLVDPVPANATVRLNAYDAEEPSLNTGFGIRLVQNGTTSYLTSTATDADNGRLTSTGGDNDQGLMTVDLGTVPAGQVVSACFQVTIR